MFPHIWYESYQMNSIINQSFFIAYEFENDTIKNDTLFFRFPKNSDGFIVNDNFAPNNYLLNPQVEEQINKREYIQSYANNYFENKNWFSLIDYYFRIEININEIDFLANISLAHLNVQNDGKLNKIFISYSQEFFKHENRTYIINIIFFVNQIDLKEGDNDYSFFIVKNNFSNILGEEKITFRYSDNFSFLASYSDMTEYSITDMDFRFFHLGLYDNNYNFYRNAIFYDTLNLDYFYDYSKFYSTAKDREYDLKYFVTLYLYKSLFQNIEYTKL